MPPPPLWLDAGVAVALPAEAPPPVVTLEKPGRAPLAPLRLVPRPGERRQYKLSISWSQRLQTGGADNPLPPVAFSMWITTIAPATPGAPWRYELGRIEAEQVNEPQAGAFSAWKPVEGEWRSDERRRPGDSRPVFAYRDGTLNEAMRLLEDVWALLLPVLPVEPVGAGAAWTVAAPVVRVGLELASHARLELVGFDGALARVRLSATLEGGEQRTTFLFGDEPASWSIERWRASARGSLALSPSALLPESAELQLELLLVFDPDEPGGATTSTVVLSAMLEPAPAPR